MQTQYKLKAPKGQVSDNLQAALDLAAAGIPVFPVDANKHPHIKWKGGATLDEKQIRKWWKKWPNAMPAFPTGEPSGIAVLDIDRKDGKDGVAALRQLGFEPESPFVVRTKSGGKHLWFAHKPDLRCSVGQDKDGLGGVDVRGEHGFAVAPGAPGYEFTSGDLDLWANLRKVGFLPKWPDDLPMQPRTRQASSGAEPSGLPFHVLSDALLTMPIEERKDHFGSEAEWFKVCRIIADETGASEEGRELWHEWSEGWGKYSYQDAESKWNREDTYLGERATVWTILRPALDRGWKHPDFESWQVGQDFDECWTPEELEAIAKEALDAETQAKIEKLVGVPGGPEPSPLTFQTPADCASLPARPYIVKGLLGAGDIAAIVGAPGAGKSLLAPRLAYAVAQGEPIFGKRVKQGGVFYVAAEDGHGMRARLSALRGDFGEANQLYLVTGVSDLLSKKGELRALQKAAKERRPKLIVIDTLAVAFPGLEENSAEGMGLVVKAVRSLAQWGAAVVLIHHDTKAGDGLPRGHSLLNGALDVSIHLKREGGIVTGKPSKNRNGTTEDGLAFSIATRVIGEDEDGDAITTAICEEADAKSLPPKGDKLTPSATAALSVLRELGHGTQWVEEDTWRKTCVAGRTVSAADDPDSRRRTFKRAVEELGRLGKVTFSDGKYMEQNHASEEFTSEYDDM